MEQGKRKPLPWVPRRAACHLSGVTVLVWFQEEREITLVILVTPNHTGESSPLSNLRHPMVTTRRKPPLGAPLPRLSFFLLTFPVLTKSLMHQASAKARGSRQNVINTDFVLWYLFILMAHGAEILFTAVI